MKSSIASRIMDIVLMFFVMILVAKVYEYFNEIELNLKYVYVLTATMGTMLYIKGE